MTRPTLLLLVASACIGFALPSASVSQETADAAVTPYTANGADTCLGCHNVPEVVAIFETKHGAPTDPHSPFGHGNLQCEACHGPGGAHAGMQMIDDKLARVIEFKPGSAASIEKQNGMCLGCHEADTGFAWHGGAHDDSRVACAGW